MVIGHIKKKLKILVAVIAFAPWLHSNAATLEKVKVGLPADSISELPFYVAKEKRIFEKNGLDVQFVMMKSDLQIAGMLSQELDYSAVTEPSILAIDKGARLKVVSIYHDHHFFYLLSTEKSIESLKDKKIAVSRIGSTSHKAAMDMLRNKGVDPKRVTYIASQSTTNSFAALRSGSVQAAVLSLPFSEIARKADGIHMVATPSDLGVEVGDGLITAQKKIDENPEQVRKMASAIVATLKYIKTNKSEVVDLIASKWKLTPEVASSVYEDILPYISGTGMIAKEKVNTFLADQHAMGTLRTKLEYADIIDDRFIKP